MRGDGMGGNCVFSDLHSYGNCSRILLSWPRKMVKCTLQFNSPLYSVFTAGASPLEQWLGVVWRRERGSPIY